MTASKQSQDGTQCRMYSRELLMMCREGARIHVDFHDRINLDN